jgi:Pectinacetylesterase
LGVAVLVVPACGSSAASTHPGDAAATGADADDESPATDADASVSDASAVTDAQPIVVAPGGWTWVDVPESACDDGTPTGIAVNPGPGDDLFVYFEGGGACWDYTSCVILNSSTHGPFGKAQWTANAGQFNGGPFDRTRAANPFAASTFVFIPYCTGDLHAGNNVQRYTGPGTHVIHHVGRKNAEAFVARLAATWPHASRVVVSGTSAGGFGATLNYALFRGAFPAAKMDLIDDAGPLLEGEGINSGLRTAWFSVWKLGEVVDPLCPTCRTDLSGMYAALAARYPNDRLALLSVLTDPVISLYFALSLDQFQTDLLATVKDRFEPTTNARAYLLAGTQHGLLPATASTSAPTPTGNVLLESWLDAMVSGGTWAAVAP